MRLFEYDDIDTPLPVKAPQRFVPCRCGMRVKADITRGLARYGEDHLVMVRRISHLTAPHDFCSWGDRAIIVSVPEALALLSAREEDDE